MVSFLSRKKKADQYHGFQKVRDQHLMHQNYSIDPSIRRAQSLNSASQAAVAALRSLASSSQTHQPTSSRTNSLRTNSLQGRRTYTYNPKPSYTAGQLPQRSNSMTSNSNVSSYGRSNSFAGTGSSYALNGQHFTSHPDQRYSPYSEKRLGFSPSYSIDEESDEGYVSTVKTTKVVDPAGRTMSLTTETIRALPDGSQVIETKTTNLSRPSSRSNSLQGHSSSSINPVNLFSLSKIEEDLHDFDSSYMDASLHPHPHAHSSTFPDAESSQNDTLGPPVKLCQLAPLVNTLPESPRRQNLNDFNRTNSMSSAQSSKQLKSILKNSNGSVSFEKSASYESGNDIPNGNASRSSTNYFPGTPGPELPHVSVSPDRILYSLDKSGSNIKFVDSVETIPQYLPSVPAAQLLEEEKRQHEVRTYEHALKIAMERVYGTKENKSDVPNDEVATQSGRGEVVQPNYVYGNHHREFSSYSLRQKKEKSANQKSSRPATLLTEDEVLVEPALNKKKLSGFLKRMLKKDATLEIPNPNYSQGSEAESSSKENAVRETELTGLKTSDSPSDVQKVEALSVTRLISSETSASHNDLQNFQDAEGSYEELSSANPRGEVSPETKTILNSGEDAAAVLPGNLLENTSSTDPGTVDLTSVDVIIQNATDMKDSGLNVASGSKDTPVSKGPGHVSTDESDGGDKFKELNAPSLIVKPINEPPKQSKGSKFKSFILRHFVN